MWTKIFIVLIWLAAVASAQSATINAASASRADVNTAITSAAEGDTVLLPSASSATWTSGVTVDKAITVDGNGCTITRNFTGNLPVIEVEPPTGLTKLTRITGFIFSGGSSGSGFEARYVRTTMVTDSRCRVDHNTFNTSGGFTQVHWYHAGNMVALHDHNVHRDDSANEMIHNRGYGTGSTTGWSYTVSPGSADAVYIEDCQFYWDSGSASSANAAVQNYYGSRTVIRSNYLNNCLLDQHGTAGSVAGRWWEVYSNHYYLDVSSPRFIQMRGGSGVIFYNTIDNASGGANANNIDLYEDDSGSYPETYQVGRGKDQALDPTYIWGSSAFDVTGDSLVQADRDFYNNTTRPGYTQYTYPHPLQGGEAASPAAVRHSVVGNIVGGSQ